MIDLAFLDRQTMGDADLRRDLLALFAEQVERQMETLASTDPQTQREAAHTLKGASLAVGANDLAALAGEAETAAAAGRLDAALVAAVAAAAQAARAAALAACG